MSSAKISLDRIIIGTSSWGSKINFKDSVNLANQLIKTGINNFDTAPNYGAGYSHHILNYIGNYNCINVNSKFGQKMIFNPYELLKRIYRYNGLKYFIESNLNLLNYSLTPKKKLWSIISLKKNTLKIKNELDKCNLDVLFLHSPKKQLISKDFLKNFENICNLNNFSPGISNVTDDFLEYLLSYKNQLTLQMPLIQYMKFKKKIKFSKKNIQINTIYKSKYNQNYFSTDFYTKEILNYFSKFKNVKLVIGINSFESFEKLKKNIVI